jgi:sulfur carrier protein ThiS
MEIFIERVPKHMKIKFSGKATSLLKKLKLNPATVLVVKNGELVADTEPLSNSDRIRILSVISGG